MKALIPTFLCVIAAFSVIAAYVLHTRRPGVKRRPAAPKPSDVSDEQALAIMTMGYACGSITALTNAGLPDLIARAVTAGSVDALNIDPLLREEFLVMARDAIAHPTLNPARAGVIRRVKLHPGGGSDV